MDQDATIIGNVCFYSLDDTVVDRVRGKRFTLFVANLDRFYERFCWSDTVDR